MSESIASYSTRLSAALNGVKQQYLDELTTAIRLVIESSGSIFLMGNGGSQANANHIAGDYMKSVSLLKQKIRIFCLGDNACYLTAVSNDIDYSEAYSLLVSSTIRTDDLIVYLSGSGNSMNLVKCAQAAKLIGVKQAAITSFSGGQLSKLVDLHVYVPTHDMEIAEDCQLAIFHNIKQNLLHYIRETKDAEFSQYSVKYHKRTIEDLVS